MLTLKSESLGELIEDLTTAFETASHLYSQWKSRRERSNHYRKPAATARKTPATANCALTTSLHLGARIQESYSVGVAILGRPFVQGDNAGRRTLTLQRDFLIDQVVTLKQAVAADAASGPLDINAILLTSETARIVSVHALVDQYRRMAKDHNCAHGLPRELPMPRWRPPQHTRPQPPPHRHAPTPDDDDDDTPPTTHGLTPAPPVQLIKPRAVHTTAPSARWLTYLEDDNRTTAWSVLSGPLVFQSEPPSPPLTPKEVVSVPFVTPLPPPQAYRLSAALATADAERQHESASAGRNNAQRDAQKNSWRDSSISAKTRASFVRPKNSVFHIFCPEAMALQVDVRRPVPATRTCRCGFRWATEHSSSSISSVQSGTSTKSVLQLKEGFGLSRRFLAKSHCEAGRADGGGFGCVLCTSSGRAQTYATAEDLRVHINAAHDKWQMLHDRDLA